MTDEEPFYRRYTPRSLNKDTLSGIATCVVQHKHFAEALDRALTQIQMGSSDRILVIQGPSGVGKSTLSKAIHLLAENQAEQSTSINPPIRVEAPAAVGSTYGFRTLYTRILRSLHDPLPDAKKDPAEARRELRERPGRRVSQSTAELGEYVAEMLYRRKPCAVIIDEAQHLADTSGARQRRRHMDVLKSQNSAFPGHLLLVGTHDIESILYINGQFTRRFKIIDFLPYEPDSAGMQDFFSAFCAICKHTRLPISVGTEAAHYLFEYSIGSVGVLSDWIIEAGIEARRSNDSRIHLNHFESTQMSDVARERLLFEQAKYGSALRRRKQRLNKYRQKIENEHDRTITKPGKRRSNNRDRAGSQ